MAKIDFTSDNCDKIKDTANNYIEKLIGQGQLYKELSETLEECWTGAKSRQNVELFSENSKVLTSLSKDLGVVNVCINCFLDDLKADFSRQG